jgi:hypothetical protein
LVVVVVWRVVDVAEGCVTASAVDAYEMVLEFEDEK